jgi:hypothetical protein
MAVKKRFKITFQVSRRTKLKVPSSKIQDLRFNLRTKIKGQQSKRPAVAGLRVGVSNISLSRSSVPNDECC